MKRSRGRLTYANVMSTVALMVALGGTSYAAIKLPSNSVGPSQIKPGAVGASDIHADAVTSRTVKNQSLSAADFKRGQLPKGPTGLSGPAGPAGPQGPKGDPGTPGAAGLPNVVVRRGALTNVPAGNSAIVTAECAAGERATGGGSSISGLAGWAVIESFPTPTVDGDTPTGWRVDATNGTGSANNLLAIVVCAKP